MIVAREAVAGDFEKFGREVEMDLGNLEFEGGCFVDLVVRLES